MSVAARAKASPRTLYLYPAATRIVRRYIRRGDRKLSASAFYQNSQYAITDAIIIAFQHAEIERDEASRDMMRAASADDRFGAISLAPTLACNRLAVALRAPAADGAAEAELNWDVPAWRNRNRVPALAVTPGTEQDASVGCSEWQSGDAAKYLTD